MSAVICALAATTLVCLLFDTTRWAGVIGVALLIYLYPSLFAMLLLIGGVAVFLKLFFNQGRFANGRFTNHKERKVQHDDELPKLPDGRD